MMWCSSCNRLTAILLLGYGLLLWSPLHYGEAASFLIDGSPSNRMVLIDRIFQLLEHFKRSESIDANVKFAILLSEFLIKQKVRFYESNRFEEQLYFHLLHKLHTIGSQKVLTDELHKHILDNIFQRNVLALVPMLKERHIDTHFGHKSMLSNYEQLVESGFPNASQSDRCLDAIVTLHMPNCSLPTECLSVIISDLPTYGYQRMHQVLLLYVLMHHECSRKFGSQSAHYEILASQKCSQVYREQHVIRSMGVPAQYRDLLLEQNVICGLFGYPEFLNWANVELMMSWSERNDDNDECKCLNPMSTMCKSSCGCDCNNHINSLALVYYINAFLLLN